MNDTQAQGGTVITLIAEDGQKISIEPQCAEQIGMVQSILKIDSATTTIPVPTVKGSILSKIVEFLVEHKEDPAPLKMQVPARNVPNRQKKDGDENDVRDEDGDLVHVDDKIEIDVDELRESDSEDEYRYEQYIAKYSPWDQKFIESLELPTLIEVTKASNYLNIPNLLDLCCRTIAKHMTGLKTEELRKKFNMPNDFTPEEEARLAAEFSWIEE